MKAQYQNFAAVNEKSPNTGKKTLNNMLALQGLVQRDDVQFLQSMVPEFYPQTMGLKALDLGAGRGVAAMTLAEMGFQVAAFDMHRKSISIVQKLAIQQELNISFGMGGILQLEKSQEKFDLIHDCECLTNTPLAVDRTHFLAGIKNALAEDGTFILKTSILNDGFDPEDSFESIRLDADYIVWRQTPACDIAGVMEMNGKHWTAQKRVAPAEVIRQEVIAAGFRILVDEMENSTGNSPANLRLVLTNAQGR